LLQLAAPVFVILLLIILGAIINGTNPQTLHPDITVVDNTKITKCVPFGTKNQTFTPYCYTFAYAHNNNSWADTIMNNIKSKYGLVDSEVLRVLWESDLTNFIVANPNITQTGISFSNVTKTLVPPFGRNATTYTIYYNSTGDIPNLVPAIHNILDNTILSLSLTNLGYTIPFGGIKNRVKGFPTPPKRRDGQLLIFGQAGALFFSLSTMFILITTMYYVVLEKETKIRVGMMMMGLRNLSYWVSWFICAMGINILASLVTIVFGLICQIAFFRCTSFFVLFFMFTTFGMSLIALAFLLSAFVKTAKAALILGFIFFSVSFILNLFMTSGNVIYLLYAPDQFHYYVLFDFYPPYNFAKMFADIANLSLQVYDNDLRQYVDGPGYSWAQFTQWNYKGVYVAPPTVDSMYILWGNTALFLILAYFFDYVLPTSVHEKSIFFMFYPSFWGCRFRVANSIPLHDVDPQAMDKDIRDEYELAIKQEEDSVVRIVGLGKVFGGILPKIGIGKENVAVDDLYLGSPKYGQLLALLGHNGAGKTTTISILVGLLKSDFGDAVINGKSVKYDMSEIRKTLGICPQHDILWDELTSREHLQLFAEFKGVSRKLIPAEIDQRLKDVDLYDVGNLCAGTYSGGMKRRLSVAIACIGDPEVIFLDEPTTGMDPHSRRKVWKLIETIKQNCAILLTTHSMEEADALADKIGIMSNGSLRCIGDSLSLKKKYGAGYNLNLVIRPDAEAEIKKLLKSTIGEYEEVSSNAGSLIVNILPKYINELSGLLETIEMICEGPPEKKIIRDWGISHTTLEEVYLKVTGHEFHDFDANHEDGTHDQKKSETPKPQADDKSVETIVIPPKDDPLPTVVEPILEQPPTIEFNATEEPVNEKPNVTDTVIHEPTLQTHQPTLEEQPVINFNAVNEVHKEEL
jgi:ABC-type multidrug transport system ATPase subunit